MSSDLYYDVYQWFVDLYRSQGYATIEATTSRLFEDYVRRYAGARMRLRCFDAVVNGVSGLRNRRKGRPRVLFHQALKRYPGILRQASANYDLCLFGYGFRPALGMLSIPYGYYPAHEWYRQLYQGILSKDNARLQECQDSLAAFLKKKAPSCVVLNDDAQPDSRMLVLAAKASGIPVVEIQHGVYDRIGFMPVGRVSDYLFVWGKYTEDLYLDKGIRSRDSMRILGYPNDIEKETHQHDKPLLFYLGQDYEQFDSALNVYQEEAIRDVKRFSDELGYQYEYRPHPNNAPPGQEPLNSVINRGDVFVSFNSTALIEARLRGKVGIQYANYNLRHENFGEHAGCYYCTGPDGLREILASSPRPAPWTNDDFIQLQAEGPGKRFVRLLDEIIRR